MKRTRTGSASQVAGVFGILLVSLLAGAAARAADPVFVTSDTNGIWLNGGYFVHNNMWNSANYAPCSQTLYAQSYDNWHVVASMNNTKGDGAVKTYPNVHRDYDDVAISTFSTITSTFAETSPRLGIYNVGFDIWLNGAPKPGHTEIMIWTNNQTSDGRKPSGRRVQDVTFGGRTYDVYKTPTNGYIAFLATERFTAGTVDVLEILNWTISKDWIAPNSTLGQICFGVELVSTDGNDATFRFTEFSIDSNLAPSVEFTAPASNAAYTQPAGIALTANASDLDGTISKVEFFQGTKLLGSATSPPYAFAWNDVPAGAYSLRAKATDDSGATASSSAVSVTVTAAVAQLLKPVSGATNREELAGKTNPNDAGSVPADALVKTLITYVSTNAASLVGRTVHYRIGRGAPEAMRLVSADGEGIAMEKRGLRMTATWRSLDHEGVYQLLRPLAADAPANVKIATLLLGMHVGRAADDDVGTLLTALYRQDAHAGRFVSSILRGLQR